MKNRTILIVVMCILIGIIGVETGILIANKHADKRSNHEEVGVIVNTTSSDKDLNGEKDTEKVPENESEEGIKEKSKEEPKEEPEEDQGVQLAEETAEPITTLMDLYGSFKMAGAYGLTDQGDYYSTSAEIYGFLPGSTTLDWPGDLLGTEEIKIAKNAVVHWFNPGEAPDFTLTPQDISLDEYVHMHGRDYSSAVIRMMGEDNWTQGNAPIEYNEKGYIVVFYDAPVS